jgi:hypothetical protein
MRQIRLILFLSALPYISLTQTTFSYPVDVVYQEASESYYVSNWAEGNGYILRLNSAGQVVENFYNELHYPGGLCLVGDTLYFTDNLSIWDTLITPSYLKGINLNNGLEVLNFEISTTGTYLDLIDTDNQGNLFIGNTREGGTDGIVHKFNIASQQLSNIATGITKPFGICYDHLNDRVLFVQSSGTLSFVKSVNPNGGVVNNVFYINGYLEGIEIHPNGDFYLSSWGTLDGTWGNEPVYKTNNAMDWSQILTSDHDRPFGMCIGKDNHLVVCNWGENSLSFIDLDTYGTDEFALRSSELLVYPNPSDGNVTLRMDNAGSVKSEILIQDMMANIVYYDQPAIQNPTFKTEINLSHLRAGIYIVNLVNDKSVFREKLIIN